MSASENLFMPVVLEHEIAVEPPSGRDPDEFAGALWRALTVFARRPQMFLKHIESCRVEEGQDDLGRNVLYRTLRFGSVVMADEVLFASEREMVCCVPALAETPPSTFSTALAAGSRPVLRFTYREAHKVGLTDNTVVMTIRKNAWKAKDRDVVEAILQRIGGRIRD